MLTAQVIRCSNITEATQAASYHRTDESMEFSHLPPPSPGHFELPPAVLKTLAIDPFKPLALSERTNLLLGCSADGRVQLIPVNRCRKVSAVDFVLSGDKSISIEWANALPAQSARIERAHRRAVDAAINELKTTIGLVRRGGQRNREYESVDVVYSTFHHHTSRPTVTDAMEHRQYSDPQLHTHVLVYSIGVCADGKCLTLDTISLRGSTKSIGAVYQIELARELRKIGYPISEVKGAARIVGISNVLRSRFSSRSNLAVAHAEHAALEKRIDFHSLSSRYQRRRMKQSVLATRRPKRDLASVSAHFECWRAESVKFGYTPPKLSLIPEDQDHNDLIADSTARAVDGLSFEIERKGFVDRKSAELMAMRGLVAHSRLSREDVDTIVDRIKASGIDVRDIAHKRSVKRIRRMKSDEIDTRKVTRSRSDVAEACVALRLTGSSLCRKKFLTLKRQHALRNNSDAFNNAMTKIGRVLLLIRERTVDVKNEAQLNALLPSPLPND